MAQFDRETFDYGNYLKQGLGESDENIPDEFSEDQRQFLYNNAITDFNEIQLKTFKGKDQRNKATQATLDTFDDARGALGIPDKIEDFNEPYTRDSFRNFLDSEVHPSNRDIPVKDFLGSGKESYSSKFYDGEFAEFEREFLKGLSKKSFNNKLKTSLTKAGVGIDFDKDTVGQALEKLDAPIPPKNEEGELINDEDVAIDSRGNVIDKRSTFDKVADVAEDVSDFTTRVGVGFTNALLNTGAGALRLADSIEDDIIQMDDGRFINTDTGEITDEGPENARKVVSTQVVNLDNGEIKKVSSVDVTPDSKLISTAKLIEDFRIEKKSEGLADDVADGLGQMLTFLVGGGLVQGALKAKSVTAAVTTALGVTQGAEGGYQDYINSIEDEDFDAATAQAATEFGGLIGSLESLPVLSALNKVVPGGTVTGALLKKIDDVTGDSISNGIKKVTESGVGRTVGKVLDNKPGRVIKGAASGGAQEFGQEAFANVLTNWVANGILKYDPERGFITDETYKEAEVGGIVGAITHALMAAIGVKGRKNVTNAVVGEQPPIAEGTQSTVDAEPTGDADADGRIEPTFTDPNVQPQLNEESTTREFNGTFVANKDGRAGIGDTADLALADLDSKFFPKGVDENPRNETNPLDEETTRIADDEDASITLKISDEGVQEATLTSGNATVSFISLNNAQEQLETLVENSDPNADPLTNIPNNLTITEDSNGAYTLTSGNTTVINDTVLDGLADLNSQLLNISEEGPSLDINPEVIPEPDIIPIDTRGFHSEDTQSDLEGAGFTVINNPDGRAKSKVSPKGFEAYRDGFIYNVKLKSTGKRSRMAVVTVRDLDGNKYKVNANEKGQEFLVNGIVQDVVSDSASDRVVKKAVNEEGQSDIQGGIVLRQPRKGIIFKKADIANSDGSPQTPVIDAQSVDEVKQRLGAKAIYESDNRVILETPNGKSTEFFIDDSGDFQVSLDGETIPINDGFTINNTGKQNETSVGTMTRELELRNYKVTNVTRSKITLEREGGAEVEIPRKSEKGSVVTVDGEEFTVNSLADLREAVGIEPDVETSIEDETIIDEEPDVETSIEDETIIDEEPVVNDETFVSRPEDVNEKRQATMDEMFDMGDKLEKYAIRDGKPTYLNGGGLKVTFDTDVRNLETELEWLRVNAVFETDAEQTANNNTNWSIDQVEGYVDILPPEMGQIINLHEGVDNPASRIGALGYFEPSGNDNVASIQIDANQNRDFNRVLGTISHEVAHFSFDSWNRPELDGLIDRMWALVKDEAIKGLPQYIEHYNINVNNPEAVHKWLLVNEYFAEQGTTFLDFEGHKFEPPPGISREQIIQMKKDVVGTVQEIVIDLTKDFKGDDKQAGKDFLLDIFRLQAGKTIGDGVLLTYKVDRPDGTPAEIVVRSTSYGSEVQTIGFGRNAARIGKWTSRLHSAKGKFGGSYRKILQFIYGNPFGVVDTPIGRDNSMQVNSVYNPLSSNEAAMLRLVNLKASKVQAILEEKGIDKVLIENSYHKTFIDNGVTKKGDLKLAEEMDDFMRAGYSKANTNTATIRKLLRGFKESLTLMTRNHSGAKRNLGKWFREIDQSIERFTSDWDHISYRAYGPNGKKDLFTMQKAMNTDGDLLEQAAAAKKKIAKIENNPSKNVTRDRVKIRDLQEIIDVNDRLEALRKWASNEAETKGESRDAIPGIMNDALRKVTDHSNDYQTQSGLGEFISSLKSKTLDENVSQDRLFMDFLGKITDPLEVTISNLEQQNKVINNLLHTRKLAESLVRDGIARPKGSKVNQSMFGEGDQVVLSSANGGILNYLEVEPEIAVFLRKDIASSKALQDNIIGQGFVGSIIGGIKAGQTVLNFKLALSNYYSGMSLLITGGHLSHLRTYGKQTKDAVNQAWVQQATFGYDESRGANTIVDEMTEHGLFQGSSSSLDAQLTSGNAFEKIILGTNKFVNDMGLSKGRTKVWIDRKTNEYMDFAAKFYSFGDDWNKVLPYIVNRNIGITKAKTVIKRKDFKTEQQYVDAVTKMGVEIGADRTIRETNNWVIAPEWAKAVTRGKVRFIFGDYILHPFQVLRIMIENKRIIGEDYQEYKRAKENGDEIYAAVMKRAASNRAIGNVITDSVHLSLLTGGMTGFGYLAMLVLNAFDSDDEDEPVANRKLLTIGEADAAYRISNVANYGWGGGAYYPAVRDGHRVTYYDGKRLSSMNTLVPTRPPTNNINVMDYVKDFSSNFLSFENETIALSLLNRFYLGKDRYGHDIPDSKVVDEMNKFFNPGVIKQPWELGSALIDVVQHPSEPNGPNRGDVVLEKTSQMLGVKVKTIDVRDVLLNVGFSISNQTNKRGNVIFKDTMLRLGSGENLDNKEINDIIVRMAESNDEMMGYINYATQAFHDFGYSYDTIDTYLRVDTSGKKGASIKKSITIDLLKGINAFHTTTVDRMKSARGIVEKNAKVSNTLSSEDIQNKLNAYTDAIESYEKYIKDNPR